MTILFILLWLASGLLATTALGFATHPFPSTRDKWLHLLFFIGGYISLLFVGVVCLILIVDGLFVRRN